jgi:hypothetical protein
VSQDMSNGSRGAGHERCGAQCRGSGEPCKLPAGWGTGHVGAGQCRKHLGSTRNHQEHARRVLAERAENAALTELHQLGVEPLGNPLETLVQLASEARGWAEIMRHQVARLESLSRMTPAGIEQIRGTVILYERATQRAAELAALCTRLDIDTRLARISEAAGAQIAAVIERILIDLGHPDPKRDPFVSGIVRGRLEQLVEPADG